MSTNFRTVGITGACVATAIYGTQKLQKKYPPSGEIYKSGEIITNKGQKKVSIGYFGASNKVFNEGIDFNRGLFVGDKKDAQSYASMSGWVFRSSDTKPQIALLVADRLPDSKKNDYMNIENSEGPYSRLSPKFLKESKAELILLEDVTTENRIGLIGTAKRIINN